MSNRPGRWTLASLSVWVFILFWMVVSFPFPFQMMRVIGGTLWGFGVDTGFYHVVYFSEYPYPKPKQALVASGVGTWSLPGPLVAAPFGWMPWRWFARRRQAWEELRKGLCPGCGYDLQATPDRCPECGMMPGTSQRPPKPKTSSG